ncbi:helix-turn-helix transcriptional regulator [Viridibacillus sp. YIM B01967]|uniref:Helix-turn-helix transcriptional regulator n=1 Tax=Viridibacillus soli TaxID=2798301 RepID=A0ABS1H7D1_9BACL|nr:helix-turn-helix transcriptional regulator [Viridibacillus soli]MBK3495313.1 helix-turn-helix transcriptional regulator [Viridibacillus soli]
MEGHLVVVKYCIYRKMLKWIVMKNHEIELKLYKLLIENKMTYQELADITGLSTLTISTLVNNKMARIPKIVLSKIAAAFELEDIRDLIDFKSDEND